MKKDSLLYIYLINWFSSVMEFFTTTIINVVFVSNIVGTFMDLCPWWLNLISGFGFFGNIHLSVQKWKLRRTWPWIKDETDTPKIVGMAWKLNYRPTLYYERFMSWYSPRKMHIWTIMLLWFVAGFIAVGFYFSNHISVWVPTIIFGLWGVVVLVSATVLFIDKFLTYCSTRTIKEILHQRGINYYSMQDFINKAKQSGFEMK